VGNQTRIAELLPAVNRADNRERDSRDRDERERQ
jgi:hypothetical protein